MSSEEIKMVQMIASALRDELKALISPVREVPLPLKEAAEICHCEVEWLREMIQRKLLLGYPTA